MEDLPLPQTHAPFNTFDLVLVEEEIAGGNGYKGGPK